MGNDAHFIEVDDLPLRLIDIPTGSTSSAPSSLLQISDLNQEISNKYGIREKIEHHRKRLHKYKLTCCIVS